MVLLNADPKCPFEHVAAVIEKCRAAGFVNIEIQSNRR